MESIYKERLKDYIRCNPDAPVLWYNLGVCLHTENKIDEAIKSYRHGIKYSNGVFEKAERNLSQDLLLNGEWEEGLALYENRFKTLKFEYGLYENLYGSVWKGLKDERRCSNLIIVAEQGLGDTIQFIRLIEELKKYGYKVKLFCQQQLKGLLEETTNICGITTYLESGKDRVLWCPLMSLMHRLNYRTDDIQASVYIKPCKKRVKRWNNVIKKKKKILIGIHWQGNPEFEKSIYSKNRSIGGQVISQLGNFDNVEYIALQKGSHRSDKYVNRVLRFVEGQKEFDNSYDFRDTCAVIDLCDIVISSDSAIVHLAGAMGKKTYVLLNQVPEWRWGKEGAEFKWYTNTETIRQNSNKSWADVIHSLKNKLSE